MVARPFVLQSPSTPLRFAPFRGGVAIARGQLTRGQLAGPAWRRLFRDVYIRADALVDHLTLCQAAALLLPPSAALSHRSAAMLYNVNLLPVGRSTVHVTLPVAHRMSPLDGLTIHRARLTATEVARRGGLPVTNPRRTAFDLGRDEDPVQAIIALDALLHQRLVRATSLMDIAAERTGWPGIARFRQAVRLARSDVESPMETRLRLVVIGDGLPEPMIQHDVLDEAGRFVARLDLAYDALRIGLEYDGDHHRERVTFQQDAVRLNRLRLLGWTVLRFTVDDVLRHPDRVVAQVRWALEIAASGRLRRLRGPR